MTEFDPKIRRRLFINRVERRCSASAAYAAIIVATLVGAVLWRALA